MATVDGDPDAMFIVHFSKRAAKLNEKVLNYVLETQRAENLKISKRFGKGQEGKDKFIKWK